MTRYIAVASGKGGTGKTTAAINIGTALAQFNRVSIVVDGNLSTPNVALQLGSINLPFTLHDVLNGIKNIKETAYVHPSGLKIIPANINQELTGAEVYTLQEAIKGLEGTSEIVLVDSPSGVGKETMKTINATEELLIVTNPEITAITEALKIITKSKKEGKKIIGVVLNRVVNDESELTAENVEKILGCDVIGIVEEDINVKKSLKQKHPVTHLYPNSKASISYKKIAAKLIGQKYEDGLERPGFFERLRQDKS